MAKTKYEFKKLTLADMKEYIEENAPADKAWFKAVAFKERKEKEAVKVFNPDGTPVMYQVKAADGSLKFDDNGKPVMRQKVKMVEKKGGATNKVFSLLDAKIEFCKRYMPEILPKKKATTRVSDGLEDW